MDEWRLKCFVCKVDLIWKINVLRNIMVMLEFRKVFRVMVELVVKVIECNFNMMVVGLYGMW